MTTGLRSLPHLQVSFARLRSHLDVLNQIGASDEGGVSRLALTDADREGRDVVVGWMHDLGLRVDVDGLGNVVGTWPRDRFDPPVMMGSHIDTVRRGGAYDGTLGVLAGLEVLETLITAGVTTERPIAVGFFTDEEGSRFPPDMLGSLVYVGGMPLEEALDVTGVDGAVLGAELDRIGYRGGSPCPAPAPASYLELHIEQGPVLEAEAVTIGAVTGVQGISWTEIVISGQSNHAGTTPMTMRYDAGWAAASVATFVRSLALELGPPMVATVGRVELQPNLVNVIAHRALMTVDLRHTDDETLADAERLLAAHCDALTASEGVAIERRVLARFAPVEFDPHLVALVEETAVALGHPTMRLPSGAGHDAQMLARVCPAGMAFVPSAGGVSHNPNEHTDDADLEAGANVLLHVVAHLAGVASRNP